MAVSGFLLASLLLMFFAATCYGVTFSSLPRTLVVTSSLMQGQVVKSGEDNLTVNWSFNQTFPAGTDSSYKTVKVKLCYAPDSQIDRVDRRTRDNLAIDKTCQLEIVVKPYTPLSNSFTWNIDRTTPSATYFVRAYAFNSDEVEIGYGQTTDNHKTTNLFEIIQGTITHDNHTNPYTPSTSYSLSVSSEGRLYIYLGVMIILCFHLISFG